MKKIESGKYETTINGKTFTAIRNDNEPANSSIAWMLLKDGEFSNEFRSLKEIKFALGINA